MTPAEGFGLLAVGLIAMVVGGMVVLWVFNKTRENEQKAKEKENWEKRFR